MAEKESTYTLFDCFINEWRKNNTKLDAIDIMIKWSPIAKRLNRVLKRTANAVGKPAYPSLVLFKGLVLQRMYNLSDEALEEYICDRLSFRRFIGLGMMDDVPDATTFCRFRQDLLGQNLSESLFHIVLSQLLKKGDFKQGVCVDATVVESSRRPRTTLDVVPEDRAEGDADAPQVTVFHSDDTEAAWLKKGKKTYYGYKVHMASDPTYGLVVGGHVTPANRSDMNELGQLLSEIIYRNTRTLLCRQGLYQQSQSYRCSPERVQRRYYGKSCTRQTSEPLAEDPQQEHLICTLRY
ncbi:MAG: IS5 family transposase [Desulfovibrio sp.]|nr:IS5 family transposase [Desulfovibrio sp.]